MTFFRLSSSTSSARLLQFSGDGVHQLAGQSESISSKFHTNHKWAIFDDSVELKSDPITFKEYGLGNYFKVLTAGWLCLLQFAGLKCAKLSCCLYGWLNQVLYSH